MFIFPLEIALISAVTKINSSFSALFLMKSNIQILPGIRRIGSVASRHLPKAVPLHGICGQPVPVLTAIEWFDFFGQPDCRCVTDKSGATATLKFSAPEFRSPLARLSFVVEDASGNTYLIGQAEPPLPQVKVEQICGAPGGDAAGFSYEVTHVSIRSLVPCIISE